MVSVTCYGGVNQIGGNQLLLEDGDTRLFFDFGTPFHQRGLYYEEYLNPRPGFGLLDPLEMGLIPPLRGLYRSDMEIDHEELWGHFQGASSYRDLRDTKVDGVLLTHAHMDHCGYISFLRPDLPIYTTGMTAFLAKAIQDSGVGSFENEVVYANPRELQDGILKTANWKATSAKQRPFLVFDTDPTRQEVQEFWGGTPGARALEPTQLQKAKDVERLEVRVFKVDHSIPGACAYAVKTSAGWVAYTGDLRFHGFTGKSTQQFMEELRKLRPIALLCEGTRAGLEKETEANFTEEDVYDRALKEIRRASGLVIADFGPRNIERLRIFGQIAREAGRSLIVLPKDAYLLKAAHVIDPAVPVSATDSSICVFDEPKSQVNRWEKQTREENAHKLMTVSDLHKKQDQYILCFSFFDLDQLPSIRPKPGSLYIYSSHEAFDEEVQMDFRRLRNWIEHFQMREVGLPLEELKWKVPDDQQGLHASGHASAKDLIQMIQEVSPRYLIPIHIQQGGLDYYDAKIRDSSIKIEKPLLGKAIRLG